MNGQGDGHAAGARVPGAGAGSAGAGLVGAAGVSAAGGSWSPDAEAAQRRSAQGAVATVAAVAAEAGGATAPRVDTGETPSAGAAREVDLGLVRVAGVEVAIPLEALREVVPRPETLTPLPAPAVGLLGGMNLRGLVLPVLDARRVMGCDDAETAEGTVVVVAHGGHLVGLLTQGVTGLVRIARGRVTPVTVASGELLISHVFLHPENQTPVSVLSTAALLALPGVPLVPDVGRSSLDALSGGAGAGEEYRVGEGRAAVVTVACGPHRLALGIDELHTTVPSCRPEPSVLEGPVCRGVIEFGGAKVPVADPLALLGLGRMEPADMAAGVVLAVGGGYVVLAVSELVDLVRAGDADVMAVAPGAVGAAGLVRGIIGAGGGTMLIDGAALRADETVRALAAVNTSAGAAAGVGAATPGAAAAGTGDSYLVYSVGADVATRLDQIEEVLPYAGGLVTTSAAGASLGVLLHRDAAVPVLDLRRELGVDLLGAPDVAADGDGHDLRCLLLVRAGEGSVAFLVETLRSIEPLAWREENANGPGHSGDVLPGAPDVPLVRVGASSRLLSEVDLRAVAGRAGLG